MSAAASGPFGGPVDAEDARIGHPVEIHRRFGNLKVLRIAYSANAPWWWWRARPFDVVTGRTTMIILEIVLRVPGIGFFCWLLFTLAVYALPFFARLTAGFAAYHTGAGGLGAVIVAVLAGGATLAIGQIAFGAVRAPLVRAAIGLFLAIPAAIADYPSTLGLARVGIPSEGWRQVFAIVCGVLVGGAAWSRMTLFDAPGRTKRSVALALDLRPLTGAAKDG